MFIASSPLEPVTLAEDNPWVEEGLHCCSFRNTTADTCTACNWTRGVPQLFWLGTVGATVDFPPPCNCAEVELLREFTK